MKFSSKEIDLIELALISSYLVLGTVFIVIDFPLRNQLLLPLSAILLGILIYDLDVPKRIAGIGRNRQLRIFAAILGAIIPFLIQAGFVGKVAVIFCFVLGIISLPVLSWRKIDWNGESRIQQYFERLREKELKTNLELYKTKVVVFGWKKVCAVDYLKILTLMSLTTRGVFLIFILSFLILILGSKFVMEASLFALLTIWVLINSPKYLRERKWKKLRGKMEKLEENVWLSAIKQFSTLRGAYYFAFLIPSALFAIAGTYVGITVYPLLIAVPLRVPMSNVDLILRWIVALGILWVWVFAAIYPFYVTVKLFQRVATGKRVRLLKFPLFCLLLSTVFSFVLQFSSNVRNIMFLDIVSSDVLIMIITTIILLVVWVQVIWMWIHRRYTKMSPALERNLALIMTIFSLPLYGFFGAVLILAFFLGTLGIVIVFRLISFQSASQEAEFKTLVASIAYFTGISFFIFFVTPEDIWLVALATTAVLVALILLSPKRYQSKIMRFLFRTYEIKEDNKSPRRAQE